MDFTPTTFYRSCSPTYSLPMTHSELMETYSSWASFSPIVKNRTYKRDAADLIISWLKSVLKKRLWCWRLNCTSLKRSKVNLSLYIKKPQILVQRRVYLQAMREKNCDTQKIKELGHSKNAKAELSTKEISRTPKLRNKIKKSHLSSEEIRKKIKAVQELGKKIGRLMQCRYLDCFLVMLIYARRLGVGKKILNTFRAMVKTRILDFFVFLMSKRLITSLELFKVFASKPERSITYEASLNLSPDSRKTETTAKKNEKKMIPFEFDPEIARSDINSVNSDSSVLEFESKLGSQKSQKNKEMLKYLEENFENIKRIVRKSERKIEKQQNRIQKSFSRDTISRKTSGNNEYSKQNLVKLLVSVLKCHVSVLQKSSIDSLKAHSDFLKELEIQRMTEKIGSLFLIFSGKRFKTKITVFREIHEYVKNHICFTKNNAIAIDHRNRYLCLICIKQWKELENNNKKFCRGFEVLGKFLNDKKIFIFSTLNVPKHISYYKTSEYETLLNIMKLLYHKNRTDVTLVFKKWKLSKISSIKLIRFVAIMKKSVFINFATTWQSLLEYTALHN